MYPFTDRPILSPGDLGGYGLTSIDLVTPGFAQGMAYAQVAQAQQSMNVRPSQLPINVQLPQGVGDWAIGLTVLVVAAVVLRELL